MLHQCESHFAENQSKIALLNTAADGYHIAFSVSHIFQGLLILFQHLVQ